MNKKYFLLLLSYTWMTLVLGISVTLPVLIGIVMNLVENGKIGPKYTLGESLQFLVALGMMGTLFPIMTLFIKFHIELVERNSTTIENMEEKRSGPSQVSYDMGREFNWMQVMGKNKKLWWLPYFFGIGEFSKKFHFFDFFQLVCMLSGVELPECVLLILIDAFERCFLHFFLIFLKVVQTAME